MKNNIRSNFDMLRAYEAQLWRLGALAERYFAEDPNTSLLKLRQLSDVLSDVQKRNRVKNLLADLSRRNLIAPERKGPGARWRLVPQK